MSRAEADPCKRGAHIESVERNDSYGSGGVLEPEIDRSARIKLETIIHIEVGKDSIASFFQTK